jgi:hypothetical protein
MKMYAYPDPKNNWGYRTICDGCKHKAPKTTDVTKPLEHPPAEGKKQECYGCGGMFILLGAGQPFWEEEPQKRAENGEW